MTRRESFRDRQDRHAAVDDPQLVLDAALRFLEARQRSVAEVRERLLRAGYRADLVDGAIDRLTALGMLDDEAFAHAWVESRDRAHPRGERALRGELFRKGIVREIVSAVLADRATDAERHATDDGDEPSADERAAVALLERRSAALGRVADPRLRRQRAYALLARNGFDPDVAARAASAFAASPNAGTDEED